MAKSLHPDRNPGNNNAVEDFRRIQEAFEFLSDDRKRADLSRKLNIKTTKKKPFFNAEYQRIRMEEMMQNIRRSNGPVKKKSPPPIDNTFIDVYRKYYINEDMPNIRTSK